MGAELKIDHGLDAAVELVLSEVEEETKAAVAEAATGTLSALAGMFLQSVAAGTNGGTTNGGTNGDDAAVPLPATHDDEAVAAAAAKGGDAPPLPPPPEVP